MAPDIQLVKNILTRCSGFLTTVTSHSLQPYRGCTFGNSLCGVACYVQHNSFLTRGQPWGSFLEVRENAAASYLANAPKERRWARKKLGVFSIFCSSSTDPFLPQEFKYGITKSVLQAMLQNPPDMLILQTHSHRVVEYLEIYQKLANLCDLRIHITIETDMAEVPGLPPHATPIAKRFASAQILKQAGLRTVITVSPLLPIQNPQAFFAQIAECADAVVIDHFIQGDGSTKKNGWRTEQTALPSAMAKINPQSVTLGYRDSMVAIALRYLPGRVGVNIDGFAGNYLG